MMMSTLAVGSVSDWGSRYSAGSRATNSRRERGSAQSREGMAGNEAEIREWKRDHYISRRAIEYSGAGGLAGKS